MEHNLWVVFLDNQEPQMVPTIEQAAQIIGEEAIQRYINLGVDYVYDVLHKLVADYKNNPNKFGIDDIGYAYKQIASITFK